MNDMSDQAPKEGESNPFATVPDETLRTADVLAAAEAWQPVDTEGPTRPMEPLPDASSGDAVSAEGRPTAPAGEPTSPIPAQNGGAPLGAETFGRRERAGYLPPVQPEPQPWNPQGPNAGYAPGGWIDPASQPYQAAYPPQPQTFYTPPGTLQQTPMPGQMPRGTAQLGLKPNFAAMLCYTPYIGIVASFLVKQNERAEIPFVRFHCRQSLIAHIVFWAMTIGFAVARAATPGLPGLFIGIASSLFQLGALVGFIWMMVRTYKGRADRIPVVGEQVEI